MQLCMLLNAAILKKAKKQEMGVQAVQRIVVMRSIPRNTVARYSKIWL